MAINTGIIKSYAPKARLNFIEAVKARAARFGITEAGFSDVQEQGDVVIINGNAYPRSVARQRKNLETKIRAHGFMPVVEEVAYTWFNRFAAIRYMELHGYLEHGFRVLSHPAGEAAPEILQNAENIELPDLRKDKVIDLKLDGNQDEKLYRMLLVAQCNALHTAMPFLFERIEDETELLLPDNLLHSDSVIREMVQRVPESDWKNIEIIGWLYQFYISEKKDEVMGGVVMSEDIPAATQLFTPNWVVKYMVQNSLGAKWLATYPSSSLKEKMEYYIVPAAQPEEVRRLIKAETSASLDPESITFMDPAVGSGHILVEAYDLLKEMYLERGYQRREIPRLILERNLYGLDIDDRAAQLAGFAVTMRARADDRRILSTDYPIRLNIISIQESVGIDIADVMEAKNSNNHLFELVPTEDLLVDTIQQPGLALREPAHADMNAVKDLLSTFELAKTYGSLIKIPDGLVDKLEVLESAFKRSAVNYLLQEPVHQRTETILALIKQARLLSRTYDVVAANPPYMGSKGMNSTVKSFAARQYPDSDTDLFAMFLERAPEMTVNGGFTAMICMHSWMFLWSFEKLRAKILSATTIQSMLHLGDRAFDSIGGSVVSTVAFTLRCHHIPNEVGTFFRLVEGASEQKKSELAKRAILGFEPDIRFEVSTDTLDAIPTKPIAYWLGMRTLDTFRNSRSLAEVAEAKVGLMTSDNGRFLRYFWEVDLQNIEFAAENDDDAAQSHRTWFPHNKGGSNRRWAGNYEYVVNWKNNGSEIKETVVKKYPYLKGDPNFVVHDDGFYFRPCISWSEIGTGRIAFRYFPAGFTFNVKGMCAFPREETSIHSLLAYCNGNFVERVAGALNPTLSFGVKNFKNLPAVLPPGLVVKDTVDRLIELSKMDWDSSETSWDFSNLQILDFRSESLDLSSAYQKLRNYWTGIVSETLELEEDINRVLSDELELGGEVPSKLPLECITLACNPVYRYGTEKSEGELESLLLADTMRDLISYVVGCMFGRYSLDKPGLILASQGQNLGEYLSQISGPSFMPDADSIIPVLEDNWFEDDVTDRFLDFLRVAFGAETLAENLLFIESGVGKEIRKFFKRDFFNDHLRRYKNRPIYWLFSSGKERAFEALVYMHRYNEGTLARMRMNYVVPLQSQMASRIERITTELESASLSSSERKRRDSQILRLIKQLEELRRFEEELRLYADQRIEIDLNDGVKINYAKFGNLLAERTTVIGGKKG